MALLGHGTISVGSNAVQLITIPNDIRAASLYLFNNHASTQVFVGGSTVTATGATQGLPIPTSSGTPLKFAGGSAIYVVAASGTVNLSYLWTATV